MEARTSSSHPLQIKEVETRAGGTIGLTLCPGKHQGDAITGQWRRDLDMDLDAIVDWGADAVVSLMEDHEFEELSVASLGDAVEARGMEWHHLPITDQDAPDGRFEQRWLLSGLKLCQLLCQDRKILIHCKGGLGRTGTVAARLLVELGEQADAAIERVRDARPGAVERRVQEEHVRRLSGLPDEDYLDRVLGCLLGGALGDALGYAVEFSGLADIRERFGPAGIQRPVADETGRFVVSDDTQMTMFTLEALVRAGPTASPSEILRQLTVAYQDWLDTQHGGPAGEMRPGDLAAQPVMRQPRAPGATCLAALADTNGGGTPEQPLNHSKGCGAVMRVAPLGWLAGPNDELFDLAARAGAVTHGHPDGWLPAGMVAILVREVFSGRTIVEARAHAADAAREAASHHEVMDVAPGLLDVAHLLSENRTGSAEQAIANLGPGWVGDEALAAAYYCAVTGETFEATLRRAANHDGDSDSTASIAGQLRGAFEGVGSLPMSWLRRLDVFDECLSLVGRVVHHGFNRPPLATG